MRDGTKNGFVDKILDRLIPTPPDFFALLAEQSAMVTLTIRNLNEYMIAPNDELEDLLAMDEHEADTLKIRNIHQLNRAFTTPIDREDIYRAIAAMDWIVTHCKSTVNEMRDLNVQPDSYMQKIAAELLSGCEALERGFSNLSTFPTDSQEEAHAARHAHRRIERYYRHSLKELFQGEVTPEMLCKREIYHHLRDGSQRLHSAANVLHDIMVKLV